jgi:acetyltransferase-like isoleucine patch superfamily enzyme
VIITQGTCIGHDAAIGDFSTIAPGVIVSGYVRVGSGTYLGAGSIIKEGVTVGEGAVIGMGSVVIRDVSAHTTVVGNPARLLAERGTTSTKGMSA